MELWAIEYQLVNAAPEYVFEWLKNNVVETQPIDVENRNKLENALFSRNDKLIKLGLALYGEAPSTGYSLFKSGDPTIKRAALSGRSVRSRYYGESWVLNDDVIPSLIEEERKREESESDDKETTQLHHLLSNKYIPSEILEDVYKKSGLFSDVDEKLWISMVAMTARNERLSTPYNNTWMDGYTEYTYNAVFSSAWELFNRFPVNQEAVHALLCLSERLVAEGPHDMNVLDVADRWRSKDGNGVEVFSDVRTALVKLIGIHTDEFKGLKRHDDLAVRKGYYENLCWAKPDDVSDGFDKDGKVFLDAAIYNDSFFREEQTRSTLNRACWDAPDEHSSMYLPNVFKAREEYLSTLHPEWFKNTWTGELPFDQIEDAGERQEKRLECLNTQVSELHKALLGDKDERQDSNEFGENSILNELRLELQQIGDHLGKLYQKSSFSWVWLVAGAALGFMLGKY